MTHPEASSPSPVSPGTRLSKSRYLSGLQCTKRLYLEVHDPHLGTPIDAQRQAMLDMGKEIGEAARKCFPGGRLVDINYRHGPAALQETSKLLQDPTVSAIFEGAFQFEGTLVRVDILERIDGNRWRLIEMKASSRIKSVHFDDLTVQTYVLQGAGIELTGVCLMHVNRHYVYQGGELDFDQLFSIQDLTEAVTERLPKVPTQLQHMRDVLHTPSPPSIAPDAHCHVPYSCPFWQYCTQEKSDRWIYFLAGGKNVSDQLMKRGIETIDDIPGEVRLTVLQRRMKDRVEWISPKLKAVLDSVRYPVHHLDFETLMLAIPLYAGTRPYQPLPVQWSNHIEFEDGTVRHEAYLCRDPKDPREEVAASVLATLGQEGSICVYSDYERFVLISLAEFLPGLKHRLQQTSHRLWDLLAVIQKHYYHPGFGGSFSIKTVLPTLVPELGYGDLEIQDGAQASAVHQQLVFYETDWVEREQMASALLQYCARDTLAMVELRRVLRQKVVGHYGEEK